MRSDLAGHSDKGLQALGPNARCRSHAASGLPSSTCQDRNGHALTGSQNDHHIVAPVVVLFLKRGPSAVPWLVMPVYVDAIDGMLPGRSGAHVLKECLKAAAPPITHTDAPATIEVVTLASRDVAPRLYRSPRFVLYGAPADPRAAVTGKPQTDKSPFHASTTTSPRRDEFVCADNWSVPAVARAEPHPASPGRANSMHDDKGPEASPSQIHRSLIHVDMLPPHMAKSEQNTKAV